MKLIYQLRIDLAGAKPPIWRRILISSSDTLYDLHCAIQNAMGWMNGHLHDFEYRGSHYGISSEEDEFSYFEILDEKKYTLAHLFLQEGDMLLYTYDFGNNWEHKVKLEKIITQKDDGQLPRCIKGKNACPPEDIGGLWGYYDMLEALSDSDNPERNEIIEWLGDDEFDPTYFDLEEINERMAEGCIEYYW